MKKIIIPVLIVIVLLPGFVFSQNSKGIGDVNNQGGTVKNVRAIIVGISNYKNIQKLQFAHTDALAFYRFLISPAGGNVDSNNIILLLNEKATAARIYSALDAMLDVAQEGDRIIFYFSGHGDLETKTIRQNGFLLGYDAPPAAYMSGGTIGINYLQDYMLTLAEKNKSKVILITDACRSGKLAGGIEGVKMTAAALQEQWQNVTKILSSQAGELSYEDNKWGGGGGVFTFYLLRGLKGLADVNSDSKITTAELLVYLLQNIPRDTKFIQNPSISGDMNSILSMVDSLTLASLLNETGTGGGQGGQLAFKGFEDRILEQLDSSIVNEYNRFQYCIAHNLLIDSVDHNSCAWKIYQKLQENKDASAIIPNMKRSLLAALQDKAQIVINNYLEGKDIPDTISVDQAYYELEYAVNMIDESYILYNHIKARYLFLKGGVFESDNETKVKILNEALALEPDGTFGYFLLGSTYSGLKKYDTAIYYYQKTLDLAPRWAYAWNNLGTVYTALNRDDTAMVLYLKAIEYKIDMPEPYYNLGLSFYRKQEYEKAIEYQLKTLNIKPDYAKAYSNMGWCYYDQKMYDKAAENFKKAGEIEPYTEDFVVNLANANIMLGNYDEAIKPLKDLLIENVDNSSALFYLGKAYENKKEFEKAIYYYKKAIKADAYYDYLWNRIGNIYQYDLEDMDNAIDCYIKNLEKDSTATFTYVNIGNIYYNQDKYAEAMEYYQKSFNSDSTDAQALVFYGICNYMLQKPEIAFEYYHKGLKQDPTYSTAYNQLGIYYRDKEMYKEAIQQYLTAFEKDSTYFKAFYKIGDIYNYYTDEYELAEKAYLKYLEFDKTNSDLYLELGNSLYYQKKYDESLKAFMESLALNDKYKGTHLDIGLVYTELGEYNKALQYYKQALEIDSTYALCYANMGELYETMEIYSDAIDCYLKAMKFNKKYEYHYYTIGSILSNRMKKYNEAIPYYEKYIVYAPDRYLGYQGIGYAYLYQDKPKKALPYFEQGIQKEPDEAWNYYNMTCYYSLTGDAPKALEYLETALKKGFDDFDHISTDPDIELARKSEGFDALIRKYTRKE